MSESTTESEDLLTELKRLAGPKLDEGLRIAIAGIKNGINAEELDEAVHVWGATKWRGFDVDSLRTLMDNELRAQLRVSHPDSDTATD